MATTAAGEEREEWLKTPGLLAKSADTRSRVFDDPCFLPRVLSTVKYATVVTNNTMGKDRAASPSLPYGSNNGLTQERTHQQGKAVPGGLVGATAPPQVLQQDPAFEAPPLQASPVAADILRRVFTVLRNSCAGCPVNNQALSHTGLAEAALQFAIDQAPYACGASSSHPPAVGANCARGKSAGAGGDPGSAASEVTATAATEVSDTADTRLAVRAGLQFACNYCVGSEENKALLWDAWFPRGLMELVNGLKTDRGLLYLAIALIHNCCLSSSPPSPPPRERGVDGKGGTKEARQDTGGRGRLGRLVADRAFCCLLMKVVVPYSPGGGGGGGVGGGGGGDTPGMRATGVSGAGADADPAAEWLYLLFCRFVQERLCRDVYDNVGVRAGGRRRQQSLRQTGAEAEALGPEGWWAEGGCEGDGAAVKVGGSSHVALGGGGAGAGEGERGQEDDEDFFFPVTPEQLIVLNLAEIAAGDDVVTGGEHPSPQQRQACDALVAWLVGLLSAMPLDQSLLQKASAPSSAVVGEEEEGGKEGDIGGERIDAETERVRRSMREEARSAVLRTLATLLAGCGEGTRRAASSVGTAPPGAREPGRHSVPPPSPRTASAMFGHPETRLVPLCLRLLHGCGGAADPKPGGVDSPGRVGPSSAAALTEGEPSGGARRAAATRTPPGLPRGRVVPAGRKVELLKVIGNACFRCRTSQDSVREDGGLPLVLNHCAVDGANPLLREYALLAVRNLCEGNPANQASIAALQPQGCTPGMSEALADMGLEGHVDSEGNFKVGPRAAAPMSGL